MKELVSSNVTLFATTAPLGISNFTPALASIVTFPFKKENWHRSKGQTQTVLPKRTKYRDTQ